MNEKIEEYESLRNEIISIEEQQTNILIYMYVIFCSLFVLGLEWSHYLFLTTYIVLIPFQCIINNFREIVVKLSTYIRVFFENNGNEIHWETLQTYYPYCNYYKENPSRINNIIRRSGSIHLGGLSSLSFLTITLKNSYSNNNNLFEVKVTDILLMTLSVVLFFVIFMINKEYNKKRNDELEGIITEYKSTIDKKGYVIKRDNY